VADQPWEIALPDLRFASDSDDFAKLDKERALRATLLELTANLMRVVRGAGKAERIAAQTNAFAIAFNEYSDIHGHGPAADLLREILHFRSNDPPDGGLPEDTIAESAICRTALQVVASKLLDQKIPLERALGVLHQMLLTESPRNFDK
jgi:hypothetical protein